MSAVNDLHLLRPMALLGLLPLLLTVIGLWYNKRSATDWQTVIDAKLLPYLTDSKTTGSSRLLLWGLASFWLIGCIALAGPSWEKAPSQVHRNADALIILLDLSPSMLGEDIKPTRLIRARLKIAELLQQRTEGDTALIAYADQAHVVTPLTEDTQTISALLPALHPRMMPAPGSRTEAAVDRAIKMLTDAGYRNGELLLFTDGIAESAQVAIREALQGSAYRLSILGIGSDKPVPIPSGNGGFMRDNQGNVITTALASGQLQRLARASDGRYVTSTFDTSDLSYLLAPRHDLSPGEYQLSDSKMDTWLDRGPWLAILLLPLALLVFRKGILVAVLLTSSLLFDSPVALAESSMLDKLLLSPDQRGAKALSNGQAEVAAQEFKDPAWRGAALYRAGQYEQAATSFAQLDTAQAHYNRGNALAQMGKLDQALAAYDQALEIQPELQDAASNKALIEQLKQQEQSDSSSSNQEQDSKGEQNPSQQQQDQSGQSTDDDSNESEGEQNQNDQASSQGEDQAQNNSEPKPGDDQGQSASAASDSQEQGQASSAQSSSAAQEQGQNQDSQQASASSTASSQGSQNQTLAEQPLTAEEKEQRQAEQQWLRNIPDDPSGLLRNKFQYEYRKNRMERQFKGLNDFGNEEQRW
ncbi:vWA domain-containing protein [Gilvimarinus sp. 1_MG-2023]|uniref:vWA domain-containing protein n=1 Tax=Gilvimarinus sp. 1_MG-2023 TaxID=3062638 RepID=UPI0026E33666|nr:VWA domain-containing protein [Gilvimarinus sp. 1_MG-2023]MDO6745728.1 VWA domain-containing protein [Gilvimarinus sp. 1_MG-2023]